MPLWDSKLLKSIEGGDGSIAQKMVNFMLNKVSEYPFKNKYKAFGPNCNTFIQWVLNHFSESGFVLPMSALGKKYKLDKK